MQADSQCHTSSVARLCVVFSRESSWLSAALLRSKTCRERQTLCSCVDKSQFAATFSSGRPPPDSRRGQKWLGRTQAQLATSEAAETERFDSQCSELVGSLDRFPDDRLQKVAHPSATPLLFLEHIQYQWKTLQERVPDLADLPLPPEIALQTSAKGKCGARVENWAFQSDTMRRVRMTYFYSGDGGQAYNCLVYPDTRFDVPLLGVDLICLGKDRILYVIDFQPLQMSDDYLEKYTAILAPVHEQYLDLIGSMSAKHFDEAQFFSKRMLFVRTADTDLFKAPHGRLFHALMEYLAAYHAVLERAVPDGSADARQAVQAAQDAYDVYSEQRDPAIGLFRSYFGHEWAESFTKDFLFPGSRRTDAKDEHFDVS
ncbi:hypothetical protein KFL_006190010 [Klebsormidium nitens]|uniref:15,16-dihydrobiliverdin:ferredoxin oxidoreductase n=1 Tax=Klebsormidium nitens TaxID=105231 RepID=A0A1Y1IM74_KLENI|nr:hypothetical protein KFL_006190010 [Klebsormidium nitens]|eukprot:GAQ90251.1 hypothetical protein KFL_006190010 [Klebsormidium nitens]